MSEDLRFDHGVHGIHRNKPQTSGSPEAGSTLCILCDLWFKDRRFDHGVHGMIILGLIGYTFDAEASVLEIEDERGF